MIKQHIHSQKLSMIILFFVLIIGGFLFAGCGSAGSASVAIAESTASMNIEGSAATPAANVALGYDAPVDADGISAGEQNQQPEQAQESQDQERIILRDGSMSIIAEDPEATIDAIAMRADELGGWVVTSSVNAFTDRSGKDTSRGSITVRIPAERLDEVIMSIRDGALEVISESVTGRDVTAEYVDISSRLGNLQAAEAQLQEILLKAETVEDVLAVQRELTAIRGEIEVLQGRINFFNEAAAFSSLRIDVQPQAPDPVEVQTVGWNPGSTLQAAISTLINLVQGLVDIIIFLVVVLLPIIIVASIPAWFIWRQIMKRVRTNAKNTSEETSDTVN